MQPVAFGHSLSSYAHDWLIETLAPLNSKRFAALEELSACTNIKGGSTQQQ